MNVLFLDIDGVLNSRATAREHGSYCIDPFSQSVSNHLKRRGNQQSDVGVGNCRPSLAREGGVAFDRAASGTCRIPGHCNAQRWCYPLVSIFKRQFERLNSFLGGIYETSRRRVRRQRCTLLVRHSDLQKHGHEAKSKDQQHGFRHVAAWFANIGPSYHFPTALVTADHGNGLR
jgi:hypothetical protein